MNSLLGLSITALAGIGFCVLGKYIHKDNQKGSRNLGAGLIFIGACLLARTAFGDWMRSFGAFAGVLALLLLIFCGWVIWRDVYKDKKADGRAAAALFLLPFVFSIGLAQLIPAVQNVQHQVRTSFDTSTVRSGR
jgi:glucose uptake protein GlcU